MSEEKLFVEVEVSQILVYEVEVETDDADKAEKMVLDGEIWCDPYDGAELTDIVHQSVLDVRGVFTKCYGLGDVTGSETVGQ